jgi:hypothetical protein
MDKEIITVWDNDTVVSHAPRWYFPTRKFEIVLQKNFVLGDACFLQN